MKLHQLLLATFLAAVCIAYEAENFHYHGHEYLAVYGCAYYLAVNVVFSKKSYDYAQYCKNINGMATFVGCLNVTERANEASYDFFQEMCATRYKILINQANITTAYEYLEANGVTYETFLAEGYNASTPITFPVYPDKDSATVFVNAETKFFDVYYNSMWYGLGSIGYWILVCLIAAVANWSMILFPGVRTTLNGSISRKWRKYVTVPALFSKKASTQQNFVGEYVSMLIPTRIESIVSLVFFFALMGLCAADISYIEGDPIFKSKNMALTRYISDRTGIVCTVLMPVMLLFGGRNNFMIWLTRWNFTTFVGFHRWIARWVVLMAFIHSVGYTYMYVKEGYYEEELEEDWFVWGIVATTAGCLICFQGLLYLRRYWYDTFLVIHIVLAVVWVVGAWYHVSIMGYSQIMYTCFAVWFGDRLVRVIRLAHFGVPTSEVSLINSETIRVKVRKPSSWRAVPGGHAWVYFLTGRYFWQCHPFTFIEEDGSLYFYCKVKDGLTKYMYKKLLAAPGKTISIRVAVEGSYGESNPVRSHTDVSFVAGGSGVPGLYNEFSALLSNNYKNQKLKFNYIIRDISALSAMFRHFQRINSCNAEINVYITRPELTGDCDDLNTLLASYAESKENVVDSSNGSSDNSFREKSSGFESTQDLMAQIRNNLPHVNFISGRPVLPELVDRDIKEATKSVAFICCGHPAMVDELRAVVCERVDNPEKRVDFYNTLEVWA